MESGTVGTRARAKSQYQHAGRPLKVGPIVLLDHPGVLNGSQGGIYVGGRLKSGALLVSESLGWT